MGQYLRLDDFDDFLECAQACNNVFFQVNETSTGKEIIAYAGRVWWKDTFTHEDEMGETLRLLSDVRAKKVLESSDDVFR